MRFILMFPSLLLVLFSACSTVPTQPSLFDNGADSRQLTDQDLMATYGSYVRTSYSTANASLLSESRFIQIQEETEERGLVSRSNYEYIQRGIVHWGMSVPELYASMDQVRLIQETAFRGELVSLYEAKGQSYDGAFVQPHFIACRDIVVSGTVIGLVIPDHWTGRSANRAATQTNFLPNFFSRQNIEKRRKEQGRAHARYPNISTFGNQSRRLARQLSPRISNSLLFNPVTGPAAVVARSGSTSGLTARRFEALLDEQDSFGNRFDPCGD